MKHSKNPIGNVIENETSSEMSSEMDNEIIDETTGEISSELIPEPSTKKIKTKNDKNQTKPSVVKNKQRRNLIIIVLIIFAVLYSVYKIIADDKQVKNKVKNEAAKTEKIQIASPLDQIDEKSVWIERIQNRLQKAEQENVELSKQVTDLNQTKKLLDEHEKVRTAEQQKFTDEMTAIKRQLEEKAEANNVGVVSKPSDLLSQQPNSPFIQSPKIFQQAGSNNPQNSTGTDLLNPQNPNIVVDTPIRNDQLNLTSTEEKKDENKDTENQNLANYIPAGTFVKAVMLGGADVSAGAMNQSDPSPMLLRVLENGRLPNHRRTNLKNCVVTAAVIGDISSERGKIRLERLSCVRENNKIIDLAVEGTIFDPTGKSGVRGQPVWREEALLQRAFIAGTLSGLSSGLSQKYTTTSMSPLGSTQSVNNNEIFKYGAAQGIGKAMDKLAEYNIRRAEQYHPVIQLDAGTVVDIVFLKGFFVDEKNLKNPHSQQNKEKEGVEVKPAAMVINEKELFQKNTAVVAEEQNQ